MGTDAPVTPEAGAHLILVDGSGFIFRAFHALPPMTRPDGTPVNAVFGFTNMLTRFLREHVGTHLAVIFDAGRTTFRNRLYEAYKAQRPDPPPELVPQFALVREATAAFGVPAIELADWEADDLIASYARAATAQGWRTTIVSSDKDLMQLVGDRVGMLDPIKNKAIGRAEVIEKFGVPPEKLIEVQALMGDSVDNVPGVPGIGPKGAAQLVIEHGDLEGVLAAAPGMKPSKRRELLLAHVDAARLSRRLVELEAQVPLPVALADLGTRDPDPERLVAWLTAQGFRSVASRLGLTVSAAHSVAAVTSPGFALPLPADVLPNASPRPAPEAGFGPYVCVTDLAELAGWIKEAGAGGCVAIDTKTDVPDAMRANLVGLSLAVAPGRACYVPLRHEVLDPQIPMGAAIAALAPLLADPAVLKVFHNAKFGLAVLSSAGAPVAAPVDDTMLVSYALDAGRHGHGLDELAGLHLGHRPIAYDEVTGTGRARVSFAQVPLDRATAYAAEAVDVAQRLWTLLRARLRPEQALGLYEQVDRRLSPILLDMEQAGIRVDADELRAMSIEFAERMAVMEEEIQTLAGTAFNVGSAKQLGEVLFDRMGLAGGKRMKTGAWGTDAAVLQGLTDQGYALPAKVLEWRQLAKLKSTYADSLVAEIHPRTGRVHTSFAMAVAATGRLSSTDPNLQNIPIRTTEGQRIRRAFVAAAGCVLISADYSQIELRLLAHVADIAALKESFAAGEDIHARTASEVFGVPMAGMDAATRRRAKAINFGIIYGISAFGLGRQLGIEPGEARAYIAAYFARYPAIQTYMERTREEARARGFVRTPFGRRCWIPGIADRNPAVRGYAERQAINAPLQGGAADVIKRAMVRLPAVLRAAGLGAKMLLQVHDELLFEAPDSETNATAKTIRHVMQDAADLSVPLVVETGTGRSWADAH